MTTISLLIPTRGRPKGMRRLVESVEKTRFSSVEYVWYVDEDDLESAELTRELAGSYNTQALIGPRMPLARYWNVCAAVASGTILGHLGDDVVFRSPDWDLHVMEAFERYRDRICFVHGRDGVHDERLGTHGFLHRRWIDTVGYFTPPHFSHDYCDTWLTEVADILGRRIFLPNVLTEHLHHTVGKSVRDQTYADHEEAGVRDRVDVLFATSAAKRAEDAAKLRTVML